MNHSPVLTAQIPARDLAALEDEITELAAHINAATYHLLTLIHEFDERHGCRFPGCTARHYVDAHHIRHWADGGETRIDNLLLLCRHHHRLVHEGGYGLALNGKGAGEPLFTAPDGKRIPSGPDKRFRGNVFALTTANQREQLKIDSGTVREIDACEFRKSHHPTNP